MPNKSGKSEIEKEIWSFGSIIQIQVKNMMYMNILWLGVAVLQVYLFFGYAPGFFKKHWNFLLNCTVPDKDENGVV